LSNEDNSKIFEIIKTIDINVIISDLKIMETSIEAMCKNS
jgi:hypothetical protein